MDIDIIHGDGLESMRTRFKNCRHLKASGNGSQPVVVNELKMKFHDRKTKIFLNGIFILYSIVNRKQC